MKRSTRDVSEKLDEVMGEVQTMREEFILQMGEYEHINELEEQIENLEKRIEKLEQTFA